MEKEYGKGYCGIVHCCDGVVIQQLYQACEVHVFRHLSVVGADKIGQSSYVGSVGFGI